MPKRRWPRGKIHMQWSAILSATHSFDGGDSYAAISRTDELILAFSGLSVWDVVGASGDDFLDLRELESLTQRSCRGGGHELCSSTICRLPGRRGAIGMRLAEVEEFIESLFDTKSNDLFDRESGVTARGAEEIKRIGYCTNLTLDTVEEAVRNDVNLMVTHHDAWDSMFGLKEACRERLLEAGISHYFNHLPLDDCDFGTNNSLAERLGLRVVEKSHLEDGFHCGRLTEFGEAVTFEYLVGRLESILEEPVQAWKSRRSPIRRVGLVCGGGGSTPDVREAFEKGCDAYITGERTLYTIEYARFVGMDLIIGSHTFTEVFGVESLAKIIEQGFRGTEIVRLTEDHLEAQFR